MQHANAANKNAVNYVERCELEIIDQTLGGGETLSSTPCVRCGTIE